MLTQGQFSMFGLDARIRMIKEMGSCIHAEATGVIIVKLYSLYNFIVEVHFNKDETKVYKADPLFNCRHMLKRFHQ